MIRDLRIARLYGWRYEWVLALDADVYAVLLADLQGEDEPAPVEG